MHFQNFPSPTHQLSGLLFLSILTSQINNQEEVGQFWFTLQAIPNFADQLLILISRFNSSCKSLQGWNYFLADKVIFHQDISRGWEELWLPRIGITCDFLASPKTLLSDYFLPPICSLAGATSTFSIGFYPSLTRSLNLIDQQRLLSLISHQHHNADQPSRVWKRKDCWLFFLQRFQLAVCCSRVSASSP